MRNYKVKVIGVRSNHDVEYFGGPASSRVFAVKGKMWAQLLWAMDD